MRSPKAQQQQSSTWVKHIMPDDIIGLSAVQDLNIASGNLTFTDSVNSLNPKDYLRFKSNGASAFSFSLQGLRDDVNLRVIRDANNNQKIEPYEILASSSLKGLARDTASLPLAAGTYYAEIVGSNSGVNTAYTLSISGKPLEPLSYTDPLPGAKSYFGTSVKRTFYNSSGVSTYQSSAGDFLLHGGIADYYNNSNFRNPDATGLAGIYSGLGAPISSVYVQTDGNQRADFEGGSLINSNGAVTVSYDNKGGDRFNLVGQGAPNGTETQWKNDYSFWGRDSVGQPTGAVRRIQAGYVQEFTGSPVGAGDSIFLLKDGQAVLGGREQYIDDLKQPVEVNRGGPYRVQGGILETYRKVGGYERADGLGFPTLSSERSNFKGYKAYQSFENGFIGLTFDGRMVVQNLQGQPILPIGQWYAEYYNNNSLSGSPVATGYEKAIDKNWGSGSPGASINKDNFSTRWSGLFNFEQGNYLFRASMDDGMRIWVDNNLVIDTWNGRNASEYGGYRQMTQGQHHVKVEYREDGGDALAKTWWQKSPVWKAEYFNNRNLSGSPVSAETLGDGSQGFSRNWGLGSPTNTSADNFTARFTTQRFLAPGLYQIKVNVDDGVRVNVGGQQVINKWIDQPYATNYGYYWSSGGDVPISVDYYEGGGAAAINFEIAPHAKFQDKVDWGQWSTVVSAWNPANGTQPSIDMVNAGITHPAAIGLVNLGSGVRSDGKPGILANWGANSPNNDSRLPSDFFTVRAYTQTQFDGSEYKFRIRADDGFQLFAKQHGTNQGFYITPKETWEQAYGDYKEYRFKPPAGMYDLHFQMYEGSGDAYVDLSWDKVAVAAQSVSKLDDFLSRFNGATDIQRLDRSDLPGQCVSLIARYIEEEYLPANEKGRALALGNGRDVASNVGRLFPQYFKPVSDPADPIRGSIISFPGMAGEYGHVAIVTDVRKNNGQLQVKILDSNSDSRAGNGTKVVEHNYWINVPDGTGQGYGRGMTWINPIQPGNSQEPAQGNSSNFTGNAVPSPSLNRRSYTIRSGDTLNAIAQRELGNSNRWTEITNGNGQKFTDDEARRLQVGQTVYLPGSSSGNDSFPTSSTPSGLSSGKLSANGLKFIADHEGTSLKLYNDPGGHATIGVGHLVHRGGIDGTEPAEFRNGISQARALEILSQDVSRFEQAVNRLVKVPLTQNQFDALVSFTFNLGEGSLQESDLLKRLNQGEYGAVPYELNRWIYSGNQVLQGLVNRRKDEGILFSSGSTTPTNTTISTPSGRYSYAIRSGDTLSAIAQREMGNADRWREITKDNGQTFTDDEARRIFVGQIVYLPGNTPASTPPRDSYTGSSNNESATNNATSGNQNASSTNTIAPGRMTSEANFSLDGQSIWGGGQGLSLGGSFSGKFDPKWNFGSIGDLSLDAHYSFEAFMSSGTFKVDFPALFDVSWQQSQGGNSIAVNFGAKLKSEVTLDTLLGASFKAEVGASAKLSTNLGLLGTKAYEMEVSGKLDSGILFDKSPLALDLGLAGQTRGMQNLKAEDTAFQAIDVLKTLALFPQTAAAATALTAAGGEIKLGANIKQESFFNIRGFEIDFDGQKNGNELVIGLNGSGTLNIPLAQKDKLSREFKFTPTVKPIVDFWTQFSVAGRTEVAFELATLGKSLTKDLPSFLQKSVESALPKITYKETQETPYSSPRSSEKFNPYDVSKIMKLGEVNIKLS